MDDAIKELTHFLFTGKNPIYAQAQIKLFARQHGVLCKAVVSAVFAVYE